jgi:hypothetical protein
MSSSTGGVAYYRLHVNRVVMKQLGSLYELVWRAGPKHGDEDLFFFCHAKHQQKVLLNQATKIWLLPSDGGNQQTLRAFRSSLMEVESGGVRRRRGGGRMCA